MDSISVKAHAKVNLFLRVLGRRPDGYHDLEMVMVPITLADDLEMSLIPEGIELSVEGRSDAGMLGEGNLAWRAARAMLDEAGARGGVRIKLVKRVPLAAGLGGGSSDAAAVLRGLDELLGLGWPPERLMKIGAKLGADVPFFCQPKPAYVRGAGEEVHPYDVFPNLAFLLVNPGFAVSTRSVYEAWDRLHAAHESDIPGIENEQLTGGGRDARFRPLFKAFRDVISSLRNDLEEAAIPDHPEIAEIKSRLIEAGAAGALMSGSGPTVFGLFESGEARDEAAARIGSVGRWEVFAAEALADLSG